MSEGTPYPDGSPLRCQFVTDDYVVFQLIVG
jgi:hypothetical protein